VNLVALITGITGQDGTYLSKLLLEKGYKVYGLTRNKATANYKNLNYLSILDDVCLIELPVLDKKRIEDIIHEIKPDELYNLASQSSVGYSFADPDNTLQYNIHSVLYWLEAIKNKSQHTKFYQASSSEMFGNVNFTDLPLKESFLFHPASPYGISKSAAHWLAVNYRESNAVFSACGILFNHESPLRGDRFVVKKVINTAVKIKMGLHKGPLTLGNLSIQRDWGYAPEYVKAMWMILQQEKPSDFLICSGNKMSLLDLTNYVFKSLDLETDDHVIKDNLLLRPNDLGVIFGDNSKAKSILGWDYNMTNEMLLQRLIEDEYKFISWELEHSN
jgi:GDPmannose 4,6-dehydratase